MFGVRRYTDLVFYPSLVFESPKHFARLGALVNPPSLPPSLRLSPPSPPPCGAVLLPTNRTLLMVQALIVKDGARVMSLTDGTSKMSKSDPVEGSRINLTDSPDVINKKASYHHYHCLHSLTYAFSFGLLLRV